uniref:Uncharacterized protein n=1 Tax=Eutreptiella gymnastica TaxID=73025 RepID=A0A7S1INE1_9EUGL
MPSTHFFGSTDTGSYPSTPTRTWQQTTHDPHPTQTHTDYIIAPVSLKVIQATATTDLPICTDHKLLIPTFHLSQPAYEVVGSSIPKLYETQPDADDLQAFVAQHNAWSQQWTPSLSPPLTGWMQKSLELSIQYLGPGTGRKAKPRKILWHSVERKVNGLRELNFNGTNNQSKKRIRQRKHSQSTQYGSPSSVERAASCPHF